MKILRRPSINIQDRHDIRIPPRKRNFLSEAKSEANVKHRNITDVPIRAVGTILGSILMTISRRGPRDIPLKKAKAARKPILLKKLLGVWGVMCKASMKPKDPRTVRRPSCR